MPTVDETSDILGGKINSPPPPKTGLWNTMSFTAKSTLTLVLVLIAYVAFANVWRQVMRWREKSYRLSLRRKHGIPDNDHRPFNVAYAAVLRAKREDSNKNVAPAGRTPVITQGGQAVSDQRQGAQQTYGNVYTPLDTTASAAGSIRQRQGAPLRHAESSWSTPGLPGRYVSEGISSALGNGSRLRTVSSNSNTLSNARGASVGQADFERSPSKRRFDPDGPNGLAFVDERGEGEAADGQGTTTRGSKRGLDDAEGYDDAYYYYDDGDEAAGPSKRKRDKRARKVSMEKNPNGQLVVVSGNVSEDMEVDDEEGEGDDIVTDLRDVVRGKKRDRAEAGSTFGGDDDDESQPEEDVANLSTKERRHRKRRTVSKRKSDAGIPIRGRKRDRGDSDSEHSEVESSEESDGSMDHGKGKRKHKKRGKRGSHVHEAGTPRYNGYEHGSGSGSDVSMDGSRVSSQPGCKGRKIGEEWESSGVRYKVGPSGERLRMVLVKQARNKFVMPADSQHPDRDANMEIWVGEWLTDEEYKAAKLQQLTDSLSTSTTSSTEPETPQPEETTISSRASVPAPPVTGKNLLWEAPMTPSQRRYSSQYRDFKNNSLPKDPFRQSVATNIGLRVNPFQQQAPVSSSRRLSSPNPRSLFTSTALQSSTPGSPLSASSMTSSLADSTNILGSGAGLSMSMLGHRGSPRRGFSKWEKQDREAEAMRKVREAKRAKEKEREDKEKREKEACAPVAAPLTLPTPAPAPTATATPALPTFAFSKPAEEKDKATSAAAPAPSAPTAAAAGKPASLLGFGPPPAVSNSNDAPKAAAAPAAAPAALSTFGGPAAPKPQEKPSNPFSGPSPSSSSTPSFSFGKPAEPTSTAPPTSYNPPAQPATSFPTFSNPAPAASSAPTDATSNKPAATSGPLKFAFGPTSGGASSTPATTTPAPGGFAWGAPPAQPSGAQPSSVPDASSQPKPTAPSEPLKFSFPKPGQSNNIFGQNGSNPSMPTNSNSTAPKTNTFSFGPNAATSTAAPSTSNDASKPAAPSPAAFGFGAPKAASATPAATPSETPKFSFGFGNKSEPARSDAKPTSTFGGFGTANPSATSAPSATAASSPFGSNAFGGSSAPAASSNNNVFGAGSAPSSGSQPAEAPKSAFSGFGNNSGKPSAFGSTTPASSPFGAFGGVNGANVFGSSNGGQPKQASSFGAPSSTPAAPSSTFGFGQTTSTPSSTPADVPKAAPTFSFGTPSTATPASTPAASGSGGFSFNFGGNKTAASSSPFGSAPSAAPPSVFGNTDKPAGVFGFGAPSTTPSGTPASGGFSFGVPSTPSK